MSVRVRLVDEPGIKAIQDNGLHEDLIGDLAVARDRALGGLVAGLPPNGSVSLTRCISALAQLLGAQQEVRTRVEEVIALGAEPLDAEELLQAMAAWVIDRQIGGGFDYEPRDEVPGPS